MFYLYFAAGFSLDEIAHFSAYYNNEVTMFEYLKKVLDNDELSQLPNFNQAFENISQEPNGIWGKMLADFVPDLEDNPSIERPKTENFFIEC